MENVFNYLENKLDYMYVEKFQKLTKLIKGRSECTEQQWMKNTSKSSPQFKLFNTMHIIFANLDICLIFLWYFFTKFYSETSI